MPLKFEVASFVAVICSESSDPINFDIFERRSQEQQFMLSSGFKFLPLWACTGLGWIQVLAFVGLHRAESLWILE
jgi:hypothetical protein